MPRGLTIAEVIDKNKIASDRVWLFALKIYVVDNDGVAVTDVRLVNNSEDVTIDAETYTAFAFTVDKSESDSDLGGIQVGVQDQTRLVQQYLQLYQGLIGREVDVIMTLTDSGTPTATTNADLVERYKIMGASTQGYVISFELGAENPLNSIVPSGVQSKDRCRWRYKSTECGYVGGTTTCDFTLDGANGCVSHSNEDRFGGFPGISIR